MEPRLPETAKMPELPLRQELKNRFPDINQMVLVKIMKLCGNDRDQCVQVLENKKALRLILDGQQPFANQDSSSQGAVNNFTGNGNSSTVGNVGGASGAPFRGGGGTRLQELPVQHETKHISTVQHTLGPPALPPKPFSQPLDAKLLANPVKSSVPGRPALFIDPANQVKTPQARPSDFSPFINSTARAEIPNIRCNPINSTARAEIPNIRCNPINAPAAGHPVRVINVTNLNTDAGGKMTMLNPARSPKPQYAFFNKDSGCVVSVQPKDPILWQDEERPETHSSSIFIDPATSVMNIMSVVTPDPSDLEVNSSAVAPQQQYRAGVGGYVDSQGPSAGRQQYQAGAKGFLDSQSPSAGRLSTMQQIAMSLAPQAPAGQTAYSGFPFSAPRYNSSGFSADVMSSPGPTASSDRIVMSVVNSERYNPQDGPSYPVFYPGKLNESTSASVPSNHQRVFYPGQLTVSQIGAPASTSAPVPSAHGSFYPGQLNESTSASVPSNHQRVSYPGQLTVSQIGAPASTSAPVPSAHSSMSSPMLPKAPRLQHQRSTGSSSSRSDSLDSEHGSVGSHMASDFNALSSPGAFYNPLTSPNPLQQRVGGAGQVIGMTKISSSPNQSSLSPESSSSNSPQELPSIRGRSGSLQEEAAYSQALLHHQHMRKQKLEEEMAVKQSLLQQLRAEVSEAEKKKIIKSSQSKSFPTADDIARMCELNRRLLTDIQMYQNEIDMYKNGQTPFNVMDPMGQQNFFNNMPTGPNDLFTHQSHQRQSESHQRPTTPPPQPPPRLPSRPPLIHRINSADLTTPVPTPPPGQTSGGGSGDSEEGAWSCSACTFENHPALKKCEMCEMPRMTGS